MKVTIHQPNYLPYPGLFHKLILSDMFVILDNVQFQYDITNRNKIISKDGSWERITVPVKKNQTHKKIIDVEINNEISWSNNTFQKLYDNYSSSKAAAEIIFSSYLFFRNEIRKSINSR